MKLGIMQPYFFPYLGYFSLIKATNKWIVFDPVQFIRHGWIERNRVLNPQSDWQYIKVPLVKHSRNTLIKDIEIRKEESWKQKIFAQLICYKKKSPFYNEIISFLEETFEPEFETITEQNTHILASVCNFLDIPFNYEIYSQSELDVSDKIFDAGDWALEISKKMNANEYINPANGESLFDKEKFKKHNIELSFLKNRLISYNQKNNKFISGLSILDVIMFNSKEDTNKLIDQYTVYK